MAVRFMVGIASGCSFLRIFSNSATALFVVKHESSKWKEHKTDDDDGCQLGLYLCTNRTHIRCLLPSFALFGNWWTDIPSVNCPFLQLFWFGPPATQYCPPRFFFVTLFALFTVDELAIFEDWLTREYCANRILIMSMTSRTWKSARKKFGVAFQNTPN